MLKTQPRARVSRIEHPEVCAAARDSTVTGSVYIVSDCPTPQRVPTFLDLESKAQYGITFAYRYAIDTARGWGALPDLCSPCMIVGGSGVKELIRGWREISRANPDVVIAFGYRQPAYRAAIIWARVHNRMLSVRTDASLSDELDRRSWKRLLKRIYIGLLIPRDTAILAIGGRNVQLWTYLGFKNLTLVPYRPAVPKLWAEHGEGAVGQGTRPLEFLYVGRITTEKGIVDLLVAWSRVKAQYPPGTLNLTLVGNLSGELGCRLPDDVAHVGPVPYAELGRYYAKADVLVQPSHREAWGTTVAEAMALGCRVVASHRVPSFDDLCHQNVDSLFVAGDPLSLADALRSQIELGKKLSTQTRLGPSATASELDIHIVSRLRRAALDQVRSV